MAHRFCDRTLIVAAAMLCVARLQAQPCSNASPAVNKQGFRPFATVRYDVAPSPDGTPVPEHMRACIVRAFDAWSEADARSGAAIAFVRGDGGVVVRFDVPGGLMLRPQRAGAWMDAVRAPDGYLESATIWLTRDPGILTRCDAVTKVVLHELGHLHGLADARDARGRSVMNQLGGPDDVDQRVPSRPTRCDARQAAAGSFAPPRRSARAGSHGTP